MDKRKNTYSVKCPHCNEPMVESNARVEWSTPTGKCVSSLRTKTKKKRVWTCSKCQKTYAYLYKLTPVKVV